MPDAKRPIRIPPALLGVGVLVIALGFGLPALISPRSAPDAPPPSTPAAEAFAPRAAPAAPVPQSSGSIGLSLLRLVVALAVVCGLSVLAVKWIGRKPPQAADTAMQVIASLRVGRCAIHLVRAGERRMLIGTDVTGVKALVELSGPEPEPDPPLATPAEEPSETLPGE